MIKNENETAILDITDTDSNMLAVPREEYEELLWRSALLDIMAFMLNNGQKYAAYDMFENMFFEGKE